MLKVFAVPPSQLDTSGVSFKLVHRKGNRSIGRSRSRLFLRSPVFPQFLGASSFSPASLPCKSTWNPHKRCPFQPTGVCYVPSTHAKDGAQFNQGGSFADGLFVWCFWGHVHLSQHVSFTATANAPFGSSFSTRRSAPAISALKHRGTPRKSLARSAGAVRLWWCFWRRLVGGSGWGWCAFGLLCLLTVLRIVCLLGLLLCACFRLSLPLLSSFIFWLKAPCFGSLFVPAGGTALPLGLGNLNNLFLLVGLGLFILSRNSVSHPFAGYQP